MLNLQCEVVEGKGAGDGSGIFASSESRLILSNGTTLTNNTLHVGAAVAVYLLPVTPGHYIDAQKCEVVWVGLHSRRARASVAAGVAANTARV